MYLVDRDVRDKKQDNHMILQTRLAMIHCIGPKEATVGELYRLFEWLVLMPSQD